MAFFALALFVLLSQPLLRAEIVIKGGTLIDGTGNPPLERSVIVIEGNRIKGVGKEGEIIHSPGAMILDAAGKFVLPGLIDMHAHLRDWVGEIFLAHGVTTVLDLGNFTDWVLAQKAARRKGVINGPRIFAVGPLLNGIPALGPGAQAGTYNIGGKGYNFGLESPEHARRSARELIARGVDGFKVYTTITADLLKAVADEAHRAGLRVAGDLNRITAGEAVENGIDCIIHASNLAVSIVRDPATLRKFHDEQEPRLSYSAIDPWHLIPPSDLESFVQLLVRKNVYINPTTYSPWKGVTGREEEFDRYVRQHFLSPKLSYVPLGYGRIPYVERWTVGFGETYRHLNGKEKEKMMLSYRAFQKFLRSFVQTGGKILAGADSVTSGIPGYGLHQEMALLVDAGLTPMQAILAATRWPAEYMNQIDHIGTIQAGKLADLIVLDKNPLEDISHSTSIRTVIQDGQVLDTTYHSDYRNPMPRPSEANIELGQAFSDLSMPLSVISARGEPVPIAVTGKYFFEDSLVYFDEIPLKTQYVHREKLEASIPGKLLQSPGLFPIRVKSPGPRGALSIPLYLLVTFPE